MEVNDKLSYELLELYKSWVELSLARLELYLETSLTSQARTCLDIA